MAKLRYRKRNKLDVILTDSRPVELPKNYTLTYFYNYLNNNKKVLSMFESVKKETRASETERNGLLWGQEWHATPLKYHIIKNRFEMREMALISPISMIQIPLFLEAYEKQLLYLTSEGGFSVRKHETNDMLEYVDMNSEKGINYHLSAEKSIEASGAFYSVYPFKYMSEFHNSSCWYRLNREYKYFGKIDYSKCFDSIYTHTYTWIVTKNSVDGKKYGRNQFFLNMCDRLMQNINGSITNGIVVGPEFSRLMMEVLAQCIDNRVKAKLFKQEKRYAIEYSVCRFVDDIFIFADEEQTVEKIIELYRDEAEMLHFRLNDQKRLAGKLPYAWFGWKEKVHSVNEYICQALFNDVRTSKNVIGIRSNMIPNMKMMYQNIVADYPDYQAKIVSYVLTTIYKKLKRANIPLFSEEKVLKTLMVFLDAVFYFYSFSLSFNNTEKVISILNELGKQIPEEIFRDHIHETLCNYSLPIAKANPEDVINLVLLAAMYHIEFPTVVEELLVEKIQKNVNPLMYAVFLQYFCYNKTKKNAFKKVVETQIYDAIANIYNSQDFFMYEEAWWLFVFTNCPLLSRRCIDSINAKLEEQRNFLQNSDPKRMSKDAKILVIDYLLDDSENNKFINWDMDKEELFNYTVFTTYERTLFNGYSASRMIDDMDLY